MPNKKSHRGFIAIATGFLFPVKRIFTRDRLITGARDGCRRVWSEQMCVYNLVPFLTSK